MTEINPIQHAPRPPRVEKVKPDKDGQGPARDRKRGEKQSDAPPPRRHIDEYA